MCDQEPAARRAYGPETGLGAVLAMQGAKLRCPRGWQSGPLGGGACGPEYLSPAQGRRLGLCPPSPPQGLQWLLVSRQSWAGSQPPLQDAEWPFPKITQPQPRPPRKARLWRSSSEADVPPWSLAGPVAASKTLHVHASPSLVTGWLASSPFKETSGLCYETRGKEFELCSSRRSRALASSGPSHWPP